MAKRPHPPTQPPHPLFFGMCVWGDGGSQPSTEGVLGCRRPLVLVGHPSPPPPGNGIQMHAHDPQAVGYQAPPPCTTLRLRLGDLWPSWLCLHIPNPSLLCFVATAKGQPTCLLSHTRPILANRLEPLNLGGVFAQRAHSAGTAPIITLFILGTPLKTTHLQKHAWSIQSSIGMQNSGHWDPWQASDYTKKSRAPAGAVGCPGTHGYRWWKTAAQRGHSARCAPLVPHPNPDPLAFFSTTDAIPHLGA